MNKEMVNVIRTSARSANWLGTRRRQSGVVMAVTLIMLLVVTLLAVSSMQGTMLEEKMAGNTLDRNLAFQSTESAIREAELVVDGVASMGNFDGSAGLFGRNDAEPDHSTAATWIDASKHVVTDTAYGAYEPPRYYIKHFTTVVGQEGALNMSGYGDNKGTGDVTIFKITARGTGGNADSAEVFLRSYYGRIF